MQIKFESILITLVIQFKGLMRASRNDTSEDYILLHKILFNPYSLWNDEGVDAALKSAADTPMAKSDQFFSSELTQKLFEGSVSLKPPKRCCEPGLDLVSLNIQRGRDHGLPAYHEWRKHCKLPDADTWDTMSNAFSDMSLQSMKNVYKLVFFKIFVSDLSNMFNICTF